MVVEVSLRRCGGCRCRWRRRDGRGRRDRGLDVGPGDAAPGTGPHHVFQIHVVLSGELAHHGQRLDRHRRGTEVADVDGEDLSVLAQGPDDRGRLRAGRLRRGLHFDLGWPAPQAQAQSAGSSRRARRW